MAEQRRIQVKLKRLKEVALTTMVLKFIQEAFLYS
jgi:hypothetical protein